VRLPRINKFWNGMHLKDKISKADNICWSLSKWCILPVTSIRYDWFLLSSGNNWLNNFSLASRLTSISSHTCTDLNYFNNHFIFALQFYNFYYIIVHTSCIKIEGGTGIDLSIRFLYVYVCIFQIVHILFYSKNKMLITKWYDWWKSIIKYY